jgi:hypothetical protein
MPFINQFRYLRKTTKTIAAITIIVIAFNNSCVTPVQNAGREQKQRLQQIADSVRKAFSELMPDAPPDDVYRLFNEFCLSHYGAETNHLVYPAFGDKLEIDETGSWEYISERSAAIAWETSLPAKTYIEYGTTISYGKKTNQPDRFYYNHLHYLKDLDANSTYHYRLVSVDERGNKLVTDDKFFQTANIAGVIYIPGDMGSPPYVLDRANTTYLVTGDIVAGKSAFNIMAGGITLDLGGHTISHGNELIPDPDYALVDKAGVGIRGESRSGQSGLTILNGTVKHGKAENNADYYAAKDMLRPEEDRRKLLERNSSRGFSNIEFSGYGDVEIAGITVEYRWHQTWGMRFDNAFGKYNIHHNVFLDKGTQMFNRHGGGTSRSVGFRNSDIDGLNQAGNESEIHHNLIKRTRQNGIQSAKRIYNNEIYVDSWVVNSFALEPYNTGGEVYDNKIFLTGYYGVGILWASSDLDARNNLIHMESINTMIDPPDKGRRLIETWGEQDVLIGFRITNYSRGGQERENFTYANNLIFGRSRGKSEMRGTAFYSDYSNKNMVFRDNIIHIVSEDTDAVMAACVNTQGAFNDRSAHAPFFYTGNVLESNICNVRFGDAYGQGSNHRFINCRLVKSGDHPEYHTFVFDGRNPVFNHEFLDCEFSGGAAYNDVYWKNTHSLSDYRISWTLSIETTPGARIIVTDNNGAEVHSSVALDGNVSIPLTQSIIRPVEWEPEGDEVYVTDKHNHQEIKLTPYTVKAEIGGREETRPVLLDKKSSLRILL